MFLCHSDQQKGKIVTLRRAPSGIASKGSFHLLQNGNLPIFDCVKVTTNGSIEPCSWKVFYGYNPSTTGNRSLWAAVVDSFSLGKVTWHPLRAVLLCDMFVMLKWGHVDRHSTESWSVQALCFLHAYETTSIKCCSFPSEECLPVILPHLSLPCQTAKLIL